MNKTELKKVSIQYRTLSSQMLKIDSDAEIGYIKTFVDFIDSASVIAEYIDKCHAQDYDIAADMQAKRNWQPINLPTNTSDLVDYCYQILKAIANNGNLLRTWSFQYTTSNKFADKYQAFMRKTAEPFVHAIRSYLELQLVDGEDVVSKADGVKIFLSYCHQDNCIADLVDSLISKKLSEPDSISRDIRDVKYRESFKKFMESIGQHDYVVMIVSDNYLKSRNCLYEVLEVMRDRNYSEKLLFIVLSDSDSIYYEDSSRKVGANVYNDEGHVGYISYWKHQFEELEQQIAVINNPILSIEQAKELRIINKIQLDLPEFMTFLREHNGASFSKLMETGFEEIIDSIKK